MLPAALRRASAAPGRVVRDQVELVRRSIALFVEMDGIDRAMALAAQAFTALFPLVILVAVAKEGGDGKGLADQIVAQFHLTGSTAEAVRRGLPTNGSVQEGLSGLSVLILVVSALSFTRALQRLYARAWKLEARGLRDTPWGIAWLAGFSVYAALHPALNGMSPGRWGWPCRLPAGPCSRC